MKKNEYVLEFIRNLQQERFPLKDEATSLKKDLILYLQSAEDINKQVRVDLDGDKLGFFLNHST